MDINPLGSVVKLFTGITAIYNMPLRLIRVFAGRTYNFVGSVMRRLKAESLVEPMRIRSGNSVFNKVNGHFKTVTKMRTINSEIQIKHTHMYYYRCTFT